MPMESERPAAAERLLNDRALVSDLKEDEAKVLTDWSQGEIAAGTAGEGDPATREARLRQAMAEINDLVGNRQSLVADDLEERMARLLVGDLDPKSQVRLGIERDVAQVTAEKDHIDGVELVRRLTAITSRAWRLKEQGTVDVPTTAEANEAQQAAQAASSAPSASAPRARPVPRPTPIPPRKKGWLARLFGGR